jgi:formylglycine-generating enzyme required for sulfatase activity
VERYVCMLAPALTPEAEIKIAEKILARSLQEIMQGRMIKLDGGTFRMGEGKGEHEVTVTGFFMDIYPVTQSIYKQVTDEDPSHFKGDDKPVETVTWFDAVKFCNRLSEVLGYSQYYSIQGETVERKEGANGFRLPTEAEWEFACRAGKTGEPNEKIDEIAWYNKNSGGSTQGVGQKKPNDFGLYDMLGNVWEWVWDWYGDYPKDAVKDPSGPDGGAGRVDRGGSWSFDARDCRSAARFSISPGNRGFDLGFRLSRSLP